MKSGAWGLGPGAWGSVPAGADSLGRREFLVSADRLVDFVKATQRLESEDPEIVGAIAGSYPILGAYITAGFPNWAAKYFIDALMLSRPFSFK